MSSEVSNFNIIFDIGKVLLFTILTIIIFAFIYWVIAQNNNNAFKDLNPNDNFIKFIYFSTLRTTGRCNNDVEPISISARIALMVHYIIVYIGIMGIFISIGSAGLHLFDKIKNTIYRKKVCSKKNHKNHNISKLINN